MSLPRLILITDWSLGREALFSALTEALSLGSEVGVQQRHPGAGGRAFLEETEALLELCSRHRNPLFVSGRLDLALLLGAHLHLPARGVAPADARPHLSGRWLSVAVHHAGEAAATEGADLALLSPVFRPGSKPEDTRAPLGVEGFSALAAQLSCPAFALGGVGPENAAELAGRAAGAAVISGVLRATEPKRAAARILQRLAAPPWTRKRR